MSNPALDDLNDKQLARRRAAYVDAIKGSEDYAAVLRRGLATIDREIESRRARAAGKEDGK